MRGAILFIAILLVASVASAERTHHLKRTIHAQDVDLSDIADKVKEIPGAKELVNKLKEGVTETTAALKAEVNGSASSSSGSAEASSK
jgi:uncharacterized membrane protein